MKRILQLTAFAIVLLLGSSLFLNLSAQYNDGYSQNDGYYEDDRGYDNSYDRDREVNYQTFYDELSPHGRWIEYPGQGYVWVPDAGADFRPYSSNGRWVYTNDYEWMWVSDYDWGWAPFHYGRWDYDNHYGWYWVPGYEWSPAWVAWRDGGDYYGWAPIRPGINISVNFNIGLYAPPINFWVFTPRRHITSFRLWDYCVEPRRNVTIIHHTTIITNNYRYSRNYGFNCGPRRYDAERYIGRINPVRLRNSYNPGRTTFRNNEVSVFRPRVRQEENRTFAPRRFDRYDANSARVNNTENRRFERNTDGRTVNPNSDGRVFDRKDRDVNNNGNSNRRFERPNDGRTVNPNAEPRVFDRKNKDERMNGNDNRRFERTNDDAIRQQQMEQRRQQQQSEQRRFEKRNDDNVRQQQMEPRRQPQQMEQRKFERKNDDGMRQQQMEQRRQPQQMEQRRQPQQMEQRRFERNDGANRPQPQVERSDKGNGNGNGNGRSSKRRFE